MKNAWMDVLTTLMLSIILVVGCIEVVELLDLKLFSAEINWYLVAGFSSLLSLNAYLLFQVFSKKYSFFRVGTLFFGCAFVLMGCVLMLFVGTSALPSIFVKMLLGTILLALHLEYRVHGSRGLISQIKGPL